MRDSVFSNDKDSIYFEVKIKDLGCDVKYHEIKEIEKEGNEWFEVKDKE